MVFIIMIFLMFGVLNGRGNKIPWYDLPDIYMNSSMRAPTFGESLRLAALFDEYFREQDVQRLIDDCDEQVIPPESPITLDQAAALTCYTASTRLITSINYALRSFDERLIFIWTPYLFFFHSGVEGLGKEPPDSLCRGDPIHYHVEKYKYVTLVLSWSSDQTLCDERSGRPSERNCTVTQLINFFDDTKRITDYSIFPEDEYITLPGTVGYVENVIAQTPSTCRTVIVRQIAPADVPPPKEDVVSLIPPQPLPPGTEKYNPSMKVHSKSKFAARAPEIKRLMIDVKNNQKLD